jgi:hypothetical protein
MYPRIGALLWPRRSCHCERGRRAFSLACDTPAGAASDVLSRIRRTNYPASGLRRVASRPNVPNGFTRCPECKGAGVEKERRLPDATVAAALGAMCSVRRAVRVVLGADGAVERKSTSGASPRATCSRVWAYTRRGRSEAESSPPPVFLAVRMGSACRNPPFYCAGGDAAPVWRADACEGGDGDGRGEEFERDRRGRMLLPRFPTRLVRGGAFALQVRSLLGMFTSFAALIRCR